MVIMTPDALSQEEIDALLKGASKGGGEESSSGAGSSLSADEEKALGQYGDLMASTQADMVGTFLGETVTVKRKSHSAQPAQAISEKISGNTVFCSYVYEGGLAGKSVLLFAEKDACKIGGTMVGEPEATEFSDMVMDAFKEVCNTIGGNLNTSLSGKAGKSVTLADSGVEINDFSADIVKEKLGDSEGYGFIVYGLSIGDAGETECWQIVSAPLLESLKALVKPPEPAPAPAPAPQEKSAPPGPQAAPVQFEQLSQDLTQAKAPANLDLIMDIGLEIRVELGRTNMKIRDVLNLGSGSVVELDKLAGEPVDLLVNDVIFAKGEVVVIDENFGVRITEILTLQERIKTLGELKA